MFAVLAAKDVQLEKPLQCFLLSGLAALALVMGLNAAGALPPPPELAAERNVTEIRGTYGYGHPNTFGGLVFGLTLAWGMLRARRPRWIDAGLTAAVGVFVLVGPASRTAGLSCLALAAGLAVCRLWGARPLPRAVPWLCAAAMPLLAAVSYLLPLGLVKDGPLWGDFGPEWLGRIDYVLTGRLSMIWMAYRLLDVKIAGQVVGTWPSVDNSFVFTLYQFGPVVAVLLAAGLIAALWGYARRQRRVEALCLLVMLAYAFMECQSFHLTTNPRRCCWPGWCLSSRRGSGRAYAAKKRRSRRNKTTVSITKRQRPGAGLCLYFAFIFSLNRRGRQPVFGKRAFSEAHLFVKRGCSPAWRSNRPGSRRGGSARGCRLVQQHLGAAQLAL